MVIAALLWEREITNNQAFDVFTWSVAGLGFGLIGVFLHDSLQSEPDPIAPYLDAQRLIRELINLSEDLSSGLDVNTLGGEIVSTVDDEIPATALGLYVARGETLMPVDTRSAEDPADLELCESLAVEAWARNRTIIEDNGVRVPARRHRRGRRGAVRPGRRLRPSSCRTPSTPSPATCGPRRSSSTPR